MKREKGKAFGMTHFVNPDSPPTSKSISDLLKDLTGGIGVDCCIECTGAAPLISQALDSTKMGKGRAIVVGAGMDAGVTINPLSLLLGRTLKGTIFGGIKPRSDLTQLLDRCKNKEIPFHEIITHEIQLEEIPKALELLKRQDCVKVVIKM
ncbi:hypothetical protein SAY87_008748 [Trapa incisa]|uniref:Alcohol dehydrogenase-like C-terminal domain-containing protein n=1 Tax=Trapa incisa TaxID=236973 RepID=A0AAN7JVR9_9MYRT|nr:hypothetical protein SAY87_008748 [Trapa incisa]